MNHNYTVTSNLSADTHAERRSGALPSALIFLPSQFISPGVQQSEGRQLLCVEALLLLAVQLHVRVLRKNRLHIFLKRKTRWMLKYSELHLEH